MNIHVRDLAQMFNAFDPSPLWDRDLDRSVAEFIEDEFRDRRAAAHWHLLVHATGGGVAAADLQGALGRYYRRLADSVRRDLREQMRVAQIALAAGIAVFSLCLLLRGVLPAMQIGLPRAVDEGLIVLGWVALWRPIEMLAYGWVPLYRRRRLYQRLSRVQVAVRTTMAAGAAPTVGGISAQKGPAVPPASHPFIDGSS